MTIQEELTTLANPTKAAFVSRYFKTGKGEYGEGDVFLGIAVPAQRLLAKKYRLLSIGEVEELVSSHIHEFRQTGLLIVSLQFPKADAQAQKSIYDFYLRHTKYINNWDLIDGSAPVIVGEYVRKNTNELKVLEKLAASKSIWERRIAMLATQAFIKQNEFDQTIRIAEILLHDSHDLIHKAVGWMLREVGQRDLAVEEAFLQKHYKTMPRTMLRYAIEKFPPNKKTWYRKK